MKRFKGHSKWTQTVMVKGSTTELQWELRIIVLCPAYPVKGKDGYGATVDGKWVPATIEFRQLLLDGSPVGIVFEEIPANAEVKWD